MTPSPDTSTTAPAHPTSTGSSSVASTGSTSSNNHGGSSSKSKVETFQATFKRQSIINTLELLTEQCGDYRARNKALEARVRELEAAAAVTQAAASQAAAASSSTSHPPTSSNTSNKTDKDIIARQSKEITRLEGELQAAQRAAARAASSSSVPAPTAGGAAKNPPPPVPAANTMTLTMATDLGPADWRTCNEVEYLVEQLVRDEIANFTTDTSERLRLQNAMAAALDPLFPQRREKLDFNRVKAFVEGCLLLLKHGALDPWVRIVDVEAGSASRRTRRSISAEGGAANSRGGSGGGGSGSGGAGGTISNSSSKGSRGSSSTNGTSTSTSSTSKSSSTSSSKEGSSLSKSNSGSSTSSPSKNTTTSTTSTTSSPSKSNSGSSSGSSGGGGGGGGGGFTFKKPAAATATEMPPVVVRKRGRPKGSKAATSTASSSSSPPPKRHVLMRSSSGAASTSTAFYDDITERVYQAYKIRNNPSFIAAVFQDLFPKGLPFATVDVFFAQLADSEELQLVLAQARDVYKNQNIQHNTFVKRLVEMAGLEPDVLRAMYASKKEKVEKGRK